MCETDTPVPAAAYREGIRQATGDRGSRASSWHVQPVRNGTESLVHTVRKTVVARKGGPRTGSEGRADEVRPCRLVVTYTTPRSSRRTAAIMDRYCTLRGTGAKLIANVWPGPERPLADIPTNVRFWARLHRFVDSGAGEY